MKEHFVPKTTYVYRILLLTTDSRLEIVPCIQGNVLKTEMFSVYRPRTDYLVSLRFMPLPCFLKQYLMSIKQTWKDLKRLIQLYEGMKEDLNLFFFVARPRVCYSITVFPYTRHPTVPTRGEVNPVQRVVELEPPHTRSETDSAFVRPVPLPLPLPVLVQSGS